MLTIDQWADINQDTTADFVSRFDAGIIHFTHRLVCSSIRLTWASLENSQSTSKQNDTITCLAQCAHSVRSPSGQRIINEGPIKWQMMFAEWLADLLLRNCRVFPTQTHMTMQLLLSAQQAAIARRSEFLLYWCIFCHFQWGQIINLKIKNNNCDDKNKGLFDLNESQTVHNSINPVKLKHYVGRSGSQPECEMRQFANASLTRRQQQSS